MTSERNRSPDHVIPILSRWIGTWRVSIGRRAFSSKELAGHYDQASGVWDAKLDRFGFVAAYKALLCKVFRQDRYARPSDVLRVLDAGIGTGAFSSAFLSLKRNRFNLDGIDVSEQMLCRAEQHLQHCDIDLSLKQADVTALPYDDATFDIVFAAHVIEHLGCPVTALSEIYRVLKPGEVLIACITRRSTAGAYIQFMWRTHQV